MHLSKAKMPASRCGKCASAPRTVLPWPFSSHLSAQAASLRFIAKVRIVISCESPL